MAKDSELGGKHNGSNKGSPSAKMANHQQQKKLASQQAAAGDGQSTKK
ncbi:hypothetical protein [Anaerosporomusa subterranea]|nr:hypothetical protein [Anaerosporomusa subterranea]